MVDYRSVSQLNQYLKCPHSYYLQRIERVWQRPAAWLPQGLAVHEAIEEIEKSHRTLTLEKAEEVFKESYAKHTGRLCEDTPNFEYWFASGPYKGEQDIERRFGLGLEQISRYFAWIEKHPNEKPWITPDGDLAIEIGFDVDLDGVRVKGFIDNVTEITLPDGRTIIIVRDVKSGNKPGDDVQLKVYSVVLEQKYGIEVPQGDYWMGRTGKATHPYNLTLITRDEVVEKFHKVDAGIRAGDFPALPDDSKCRFCPVSASCTFAFS